MRTKNIVTIFAGILISLNSMAQLTIDEKVDSLLSLMSLEEKVGQMTQVERSEFSNPNDIATYGIGSILSGGGSTPSSNTVNGWANMYDYFQGYALQSNRGIPLIYGVDAVHGHNNVFGAVIFPHNIGMGCTWNPELIKLANEVVALEVAATGVDWTFSPCIAVPQNERWGRTYEGFGETAEIQKIMSEKSVEGLQGDDLALPETILACAKHFVGDGGTIDGIDQGNTVVSEDVLRELHMAGYLDAIEQGVGSIMASYNSWNGEKLHGHEYLLTDVLKDELGFEGFIVSDWKGVDQIHNNYREAIKQAINAGIDMVMVPDQYEVFIGHLISLVQDNEVSEERINDAVARILKQKFLLNLFDEPFANSSLVSAFGSSEHRDVARQAVRESMVLLNAKNDVLPLQKNGQSILVAGTLAADLGAQCGGWTITWQGSNGNITDGTDILTGIQYTVEGSQVIYSPTGDFEDPVDVAVVVIGEKVPYAEGAGDRNDLGIDYTDIQLIKKIKEEGIPVIALLVSGRPMILSDIIPYTDAIFAIWYPGSEGGGIAEVLFGDYQPLGQLTHTWPAEMSQIPINFGDELYEPLLEYKHGLQSFPSASTSASLTPYAAAVGSDGMSLLLTLTDGITTMIAEPSDFSIKVGGELIPDLVQSVEVSGYDQSVLNFSLSDVIPDGEKVSIGFSGIGISSNNLVLESFADYYVYNGSGGAGINYIAGKVEAEDYFDMYGVQTETCTDIGGGLNVGYFDPGDWMKYHVVVTQSGLYEVVARISGYDPGSMHLLFNDSIQISLSYSATNGWQNWQNFTSEVYLPQGSYVMKVVAHNPAFNLNYFNFTLTNGFSEIVSNISDISVYPTPLQNLLKVDFLSKSNQQVTMQLIDVSGKWSQMFFQGKVKPGLNSFNFQIDTSLKPGMYFLELKESSHRHFEKIIKE